jgi:hypothetical protein
LPILILFLKKWGSIGPDLNISEFQQLVSKSTSKFETYSLF